MMTDDSSASPLTRLDQFLESMGLQELDRADLELALTHRSFAYENNLTQDNERLEFLGDAVLGAVCAQFLYERYPQAPEGDMSKWRAHLVSRQMLGLRALELGLGGLVRLGHGEEETGGRRRPSTMGSALEAVIGVIFLHLGFDAARRFVRTHILEPLIESQGGQPSAGDYKTALQELTQQHYHMIPEYRRAGETGPDHSKEYTVLVELEGEVLGQGVGSRVKAAENQAAQQAYCLLKKRLAENS